MDFLWHLFDARGFPIITQYGRSWETWLITLFILSKAFTLAAYLFFLAVFAMAERAVRTGRINEAAAKVHMPRVIAFYLVAVFADLLLNACQIVAFWYPAYRFMALVTMFSALTLLAASLKTWWAYKFCLAEEKRAE